MQRDLMAPPVIDAGTEAVPGHIPPDQVAPDALLGIRRLQTNPKRWEGRNWTGFVTALHDAGVECLEQTPVGGTF